MCIGKDHNPGCACFKNENLNEKNSTKSTQKSGESESAENKSDSPEQEQQ